MTETTACGHQTSGMVRALDFETLYKTHFKAVWSWVARSGLEPSVHEEVLQEVWLTAFRRRDRLREDASARAWLHAITRKVVAFHRRTRRRWFRRIEALGRVSEPSCPDPADRVDARRTLDDVLVELSPDQREVLLLALAYGFTGPEIATSLGIPLNTAYSRLRLARAHVDVALARALGGDEPPPHLQQRCWVALGPFIVADLPRPASAWWRPPGLALVAMGAVLVVAPPTGSEARSASLGSLEVVERAEPSTAAIEVDAVPMVASVDDEPRRPADLVGPRPSVPRRARPSGEGVAAGPEPSKTTLGEEIRLLEPALDHLRNDAPDEAL